MIKEAEAERKKQNAAGSGAAAGTMMPEPAEDTDRIGNLLCHERLKKGLELEDISQVLCIRRRFAHDSLRWRVLITGTMP